MGRRNDDMTTAPMDGGAASRGKGAAGKDRGRKARRSDSPGHGLGSSKRCKAQAAAVHGLSSNSETEAESATSQAGSSSKDKDADVAASLLALAER